MSKYLRQTSKYDMLEMPHFILTSNTSSASSKSDLSLCRSCDVSAFQTRLRSWNTLLNRKLINLLRETLKRFIDARSIVLVSFHSNNIVIYIYNRTVPKSSVYIKYFMKIRVKVIFICVSTLHERPTLSTG